MGTNKLSSSCSSVPSMKPNPKARNSESKDPMRRSFSGNPFERPSSILANSRGGFNPSTPANSPSDLPRRSSFAKENLGSNEDKENKKCSSLRPARVQSPASPSKSTKNFMSPTISAASKFSTSPRNKVLVDRNEPLRSSVSFPEKGHTMEDSIWKPEISTTKKKTVSFSDAISMLIEDDSSHPNMRLDENKVEASHDSTITDMVHSETLQSDSRIASKLPFDSKNDVGSSWEEKDLVNLDPTFKISSVTSCSTSPILAPLDADPFMPPYDPKNNYLSPRPQFLHYKPNPRIEPLHRRGGDGKRLEESFILENISDSEVSDSLSGNRESLSEDFQKEYEDVTSEETVNKEESSSEEDLTMSEPLSTSPPHKPKEGEKEKRVCKSKIFTKSFFAIILSTLLLACLSISVTDSSVTDLSMLKDVTLSNLYIPPEITKFAQVNFEELACKSWLWVRNCLSSFFKLIYELRGEHKLGPLQYGNLTALLREDHLVDGPKFGLTDVGPFNYHEYIMAPISERDVKVDPLEESRPETKVIEEDTEEVSESEEDNVGNFQEQMHQEAEVHDSIYEIVEDQTEPESEEACSTAPTDVIEAASSQEDQTRDITVLSDESDEINQPSIIDIAGQQVEISEVVELQPQPVEIAEAIEIQPEVYEAREPQLENDIESKKAEDDFVASSTVDKFLSKYVVVGGSSIVLLSLLAAITLSIRAKKVTVATTNAPPPGVQSVIVKKLAHSPICVTPEPTLQENLASRNWQTEAEDMLLGESCPSEMSSFKCLSSHSKGLKAATSEAQSQERKTRRGSYRRESLASSDISLGSSDCYSYGSFTTYEKLPGKHGQGDDEVVTPVRRSSRIRKQVTSP